MALVADSGALYALYDADDGHHHSVRRAIAKERGPVVIPMAILAEVDYLLREYLGVDAELDFLDSIVGGAYSLEPLEHKDLLHCRELISKYRDMDLGLADSAVLATAERLGINRILTLDERHFRAVRSTKGQIFELVPGELPLKRN